MLPSLLIHLGAFIVRLNVSRLCFFLSVRICVKTTKPGTTLLSIETLTCSQDRGGGEFGYVYPIAGDTVNSITTAGPIAGTGDTEWLVATQLYSSFFYTASPPPVTCSGTASLGVTRARNLKSRRGMQEGGADFDVEIELRTDADTSKVAGVSTLITMLAVLVVTAMT